ncbi:hypothetical protein KHA80_07060 [Anaerobacillus sp. HL2]|nr:hypothetical protein KHA80_07060 [Anaerobacillus sp. HL2]
MLDTTFQNGRAKLTKCCMKTNGREAAMYGFESPLTTVIPGETACLACIYPEQEQEWGALRISSIRSYLSIAGCLAAIEANKLLTGIGSPSINKYCLIH